MSADRRAEGRRRRRPFTLVLIGGLVALMNGGGPTKAASVPLAEARVAYVPFQNSPFPYRGIIPQKNIPFLDALDGSRRGHTSPRAGKVYWEDQSYSERRSLIYFPAGFDIRRPGVIVVFFHGNQATLARDVVGRQQVPRQLAESGLNAVLIAPQFAFDAINSSSGNFWIPGSFARFLDEASNKLASVYGDAHASVAFSRMPVLLFAYSGGYNAAAYVAAVGGAEHRIRGLVLLDAVYAEEEKFADWITINRNTAFFFSAFTRSSAANNKTLQNLLTARAVDFSNQAPLKFIPGEVAFLATDPDLVHDDFLSHAWVDNPIAWILARVPGYPR